MATSGTRVFVCCLLVFSLVGGGGAADMISSLRARNVRPADDGPL